MIDLHLHTTASDGACAPDELVARAAAAGLSVIGITDHDTMAGVSQAAEAASRIGIACIPGIEVTSVWQQRDVHVLGYFVNPESKGLGQLIARGRQARLMRARSIVALLAKAGAPVEIEDRLSAAAAGGRAIARPEIARALVAAGHVESVGEAFDTYLSEGRPAFVPHSGPSPMEVVARIVEGGGVASLAHPGTTKRDELIEPLMAAGLDALEAIHSEHDPAARSHYRRLAEELGLAVTGGSDFHGDGMHSRRVLGGVNLPADLFAGFVARVEATAGRGRSSSLEHAVLALSESIGRV
jgi:predicted metal-dependent phosphoesterase TrpH